MATDLRLKEGLHEITEAYADRLSPETNLASPRQSRLLSLSALEFGRLFPDARDFKVDVGEACFGSSARFDPRLDSGFLQEINGARHDGNSAFFGERLFQYTNDQGQLD